MKLARTIRLKGMDAALLTDVSPIEAQGVMQPATWPRSLLAVPTDQLATIGVNAPTAGKTRSRSCG